MTASQSGVFSLQQFTDVGDPLVGGRLYTFAYGTTTHKTAYTDRAGVVAHTYTSDGAGGQYIALNARGELPAPLYLTSGSYDMALKRADGSTVWTRRAEPLDADLIPIARGGTGATDAAGARANLSAAQSGLNNDITQLQALAAVPSITTAAILLATAQATESSRGTSKLASQTLADEGTNDTDQMTPLKTRLAKIKTGGVVATTSGTSVTLTSSIPSWAKRVTLQVVGLSASGISPIELRLNAESSGYAGAVGAQNNGSVGCENHSTGFKVDSTAPSGAANRHGQIVLTLMGSNTWVVHGALGQSDGTRIAYTGGSKTLSGALTTLTLTSSGGSDTFDAGQVGVMWE